MVSFFRPVVTIGYGRVEPVRYAQSALNVQNALIASNVLDEQLTKEEISLVGDEIAKMTSREM